MLYLNKALFKAQSQCVWYLKHSLIGHASTKLGCCNEGVEQDSSCANNLSGPARGRGKLQNVMLNRGGIGKDSMRMSRILHVENDMCNAMQLLHEKIYNW